MKKKLQKLAISTCLIVGMSAPAHAFFNPFGMMGNMMGMFTKPVTDQMIGDMLGTMEGLMHSTKFRNDMANFILGTTDELIYELMLSMQNEEPTFVGAMAGALMTNGAEPGSAEYNAAMGYWMGVFGPAMQAKMELEAQRQAEIEAREAARAAENAERQRRNDMNVFIAHGDYNWNCHCYDPDYLAYYDGQGNLVEYIPEVALPGDPGT